ncbi:zinc ribbon domain-containing protein [Halorubrum cibi]|uniref:Double zinc ribbon n=1 Tax=Halorubrum cibi TaxID=413815 RepID=A0A521BSY2_9EURY|nr:zinc ribbon domain-containing protein [Halorubrum cibi]SMO50264.1 Double zinc ribbon [Halorubrum cibi]
MPSETSGPGAPSACPACGEPVPADASFCPDCGVDLEDRSVPAHCPDCGERFDDDDRFCSNCGAARSRGDSNPSSNERESQRAFRRRVQEHLDAGWEIERDDGDRVLLVDRGIGSTGIHVLLFLTTGGIGNLLYGWWHYAELAERLRLVRGDSTTPRPPSNVDEGTAETVSTYLLSGLLLLIGGWIAAVAATGGSPAFAAIGVGFALLGAGMAPPVRRRIDRRHGVTDFGRLRSVDHRVVRPPERIEEPCVVCGETFDRGLVRRRRDETVLAGVPVLTHDERYNHYCADCARRELFGTDDVEVDDIEVDQVGEEDAESDDATGVDRDRKDGETGEETTGAARER